MYDVYISSPLDLLPRHPTMKYNYHTTNQREGTNDDGQHILTCGFLSVQSLQGEVIAHPAQTSHNEVNHTPDQREGTNDDGQHRLTCGFVSVKSLQGEVIAHPARERELIRTDLLCLW